MNEVVSPAYTLMVYRTDEVHVKEESLSRIVEQLLSLAELNPKGGYEFKVYRLFSNHTEPTLTFEHTRKDSVYRYPCRIGNVAGLSGIFEAALKIPPNEGFHSGINDDLNRAATKLLAELASTPTKIVDCVRAPEAVPVAPTPSISPAPVAPPVPDPPVTAPTPSTAPVPPPPVAAPPAPKAGRRPRKVSQRKPAHKTAKRRSTPSLTDRLQALDHLMAEEQLKKQSELAELAEIRRRIEQLKTKLARRAAASNLLKKLS